MSYKKKPPIRIKLDKNIYDFLLSALKTNEIDFDGSIFSDEAKALREKIEKYGRSEINDDGEELFHLCFFEQEGQQFIWQFIAAAITAEGLRGKVKILSDVNNI